MPTVDATGLFSTLLFDALKLQPVAGTVFTLPIA
jgi:hypothetical protein